MHAADPHRRSPSARDGAGIDVQVAVVPDTFVAGEETALVSFLNGGPALPTFAPPRPYERGVGGAPTLVLNVETLAHLALIARFGGAWFRAVGTADEPGTALVTVSGRGARARRLRGRARQPALRPARRRRGRIRARRRISSAGCFGTWVERRGRGEAPALERRPRDGSARRSARVRSSSSRAMRAASPRPPAIARYLADESAGQCGPCVHGLAAIADSLEQLVHRGRRPPDYGLLRRRLAQVAGRGACRHPDGAVAARRERAARLPARARTPPARAPLHGRPASGAAIAVSELVLRVNPILCDGHGLCAELFPERIELDEWGYPIIKPEPLPGSLEPHARRAVAACPVLALRLERSETGRRSRLAATPRTGLLDDEP